jgi:exopolysaccharide biosynthesis polyprenyl glycosylphosphotransferase
MSGDSQGVGGSLRWASRAERFGTAAGAQPQRAARAGAVSRGHGGDGSRRPVVPPRGLGCETLRAGAVVLPVGSVALVTAEPTGALLAAAGIAATAWIVVMRRSHCSIDLPPFVHGLGIVSAIGALMGLALLTALQPWIPGLEFSASQLLLMTAGVFGSTMVIGRAATRLAPHRHLLLVGSPDEGTALLRDIAQRPDLPFRCVGVVTPEASDEHVARAWPCASRQSDLAEIVTRTGAELVVLGTRSTRTAICDQLMELACTNVRVLSYDQFYEHAFGRVPVEHVSPAWFMGVLHLYRRPGSRMAKRSFDLAFATIGLIVLSPLLAALAVLVRRSGPGPILYTQTRLGEGGRPFRIFKLRTMADGAEGDGAVWAATHDPRETRIGGLLRSTRLDELPQLWNILRGEMSLVGPRPERPEFVDVLRDEVPFWTSRHFVKPGITGWAQVNIGYTADRDGAATKLSYDLYYLRHRSVVMDLAIVAKTARFVGVRLIEHVSHHPTPRTN